jgi:hypothetical protein
VVNVGAVDGTVAQKLSQKYQIKGFPTIKVFAADKRNPTDYQVIWRSCPDFSAAAEFTGRTDFPYLQLEAGGISKAR